MSSYDEYLAEREKKKKKNNPSTYDEYLIQREQRKQEKQASKIAKIDSDEKQKYNKVANKLSDFGINLPDYKTANKIRQKGTFSNIVKNSSNIGQNLRGTLDNYNEYIKTIPEDQLTTDYEKQVEKYNKSKKTKKAMQNLVNKYDIDTTNNFGAPTSQSIENKNITLPIYARKNQDINATPAERKEQNKKELARQTEDYNKNIKNSKELKEYNKYKDVENPYLKEIVDLSRFEDGYDFGDVTKSFLYTGKNISNKLYEGAASNLEGIADYGINLASGLFNDETANKMRKFAQRNILQETGLAGRGNSFGGLDAVTKVLDATENKDYSALNPFDLKAQKEYQQRINENSLLGNKSQEFVQGVGQQLGQQALNSVGVPWQVTAFANAAGNEMNNAFKNNASYGQAFASGLWSGAVEVGTEYIGGGADKLFNMKSLGGKLTDKLGERITDGFIRNAAKLGLNIFGEGAEEVLSGYGSAIGQKLFYLPDKKISELYTSDEALNDFIMATLQSGLVNAGQVAISNTNRQNTTNNEVKLPGIENKQEIINEIKQETLPGLNKNTINEKARNIKEKNKFSVSDENMPKFVKLFKNAFDKFGKLKSFKDQIKDYENNTITPGELLVVLPNTKALQFAKINDVPVIESQGDLSKSLTGIHSESVPREVLENLPKELENSVLAMDSKTHDNAKVFVLDAKNSDNVPLIAIIHQGRNAATISVNALTSIYEKNDLQSFINSTADDKKSIYTNKKTNDWLIRDGLQLPNRYTNSSVYEESIPQNDTNVKQNNINETNNLTQTEMQELNELNELNDVFDLTKEEQQRKDYLEKKQKGYTERYPGLKKVTDFKEISKDYGKYKETSDFDNKLLKQAESVIPSYRDTGRRTKSEWLDVAKYIGTNFEGQSSESLKKYAIQSWFEAQPNQKSTLNRQGNKYVDFKIQDWVNAVYDGARIGELEQTKPVETKNKNINLPMTKADNVLKVTAKDIAKQINNTGDFNLKQRSWVETSTESEPLKGKVFIEDLDPSKIAYEVQSNKKSLDTANKHLDTYGYEKSLDYVKNLIQGEGLPKASDVALMQRMIQEASKRGDAETVQNLIMDTAILGTDLGQATQALSIIQKLTPEGQLKMYTKLVNRAKARGEKSFQNVEITPQMVEKILSVYNQDGTYDQNDLNAKVEEFKQDIANQMKTTVGEKINTWRYLAMLGNPKTHIRNIVSNVAMTGTVKVKNAMARTLETLLPVKDRTKTWKKTSQEIKDYAKQTTQDMKSIITGEGKYNEKSALESKKQIFKFKPLEWLNNKNSNALENADWAFSSRAFKSTLQEYLTANDINTKEDIQNNPEIVQKAINYSVEQAQIATFRQYSKLAATINRLENKNKGAKFVIEATVPFKKTPINVAKAGVNYSPLGLIKNITYDAYQLKQGNINASQFIDNISQGMTGTSLTLLGYALAKAGILTGSGGDDKDDKYDKQLGNNGYSVNLGDKSYSISWLSPVAMPLLVGANAYEQLEEEKEWDMNVVSESLAKTLDPLNEMSFMQGVTNALQSYGSGADKLKGTLESVGQSYISQFFPTLFSQIAAVTDDTKRSTQASANSKYKFGEQTVRGIMYKIPGLRQQLEPATDIWGNEKKQTENILERAFETFVAPYSKTEHISTELDDELKRVYNETGETKVIPGIPYGYVKYGDETYRMSAKEYTDFKKTYGQTANETLNELINSSKYQEADDEDKVKMIDAAYDYARSKAKEEYFDKNDVDYEDKLLDKLDTLNKEFGTTPNEYIASKKEYDYAYQYPDKYRVITQIADYDKYTEYKEKIKDIRDNTSNDKQETLKYINSLNLNVPQKAMFIRQYYKSFTDYDNQIINYINSQKLSSKEKQGILEQLGFKIRDGKVYSK